MATRGLDSHFFFFFFFFFLGGGGGEGKIEGGHI